MSKIIVGWQIIDGLDEEEIYLFINKTKARYQTLFKDEIKSNGSWTKNLGLLNFSITGVDDELFYQDENKIIMVIGNPSYADPCHNETLHRLNAKTLFQKIFSSNGTYCKDILDGINPPFTVCGFIKNRNELFLINDGLGANQFFWATKGNNVVFSNKCWPIFQILKIDPQIDYEAWKYWFGLGGFPDNRTPFINIQCLDQGRTVFCDGTSIHTEKTESFKNWIKQDRADGMASLEKAYKCFNQLISINKPENDFYKADLTAGYDSRAICSSLIAQKLDCKFYTGGEKYSADVLRAKKISKKFKLNWTHVKNHPAKEEKADILNARMIKFILWGEGLTEPTVFGKFTLEPALIKTGSYLSGGASEISRGFYYHRYLKSNPKGDYSKRAKELLNYLNSEFSQYFKVGDVENIQKTIEDQICRGKEYGLLDFELLDYFYLTQRTRRWRSAHRAIHLFDISIEPFLSIDHIKLAFALTADQKADFCFQKYVMSNNNREMLEIPFNTFPDSWSYKITKMFARPMFGSIRKSLSRNIFHSFCLGKINELLEGESELWGIMERDKIKNQFSKLVESPMMLLNLTSFYYWEKIFLKGDACF